LPTTGSVFGRGRRGHLPQTKGLRDGVRVRVRARVGANVRVMVRARAKVRVGVRAKVGLMVRARAKVRVERNPAGSARHSVAWGHSWVRGEGLYDE